MDWLYSLDVGIFRFVNSSLTNPVFDRAMPFFSDTPGFIPVVILALVLLAWKGGVRGRLCALFLLLAIALGDGWICNTLKHAVQRPRPFMTLSDVRMRVGYGSSGSMPSSHAANWFAATMVLFLYYRRSWRFMLPLALLVSFSRVYNGVHYPSDVLAGMILGAGYAAAFVFLLDALWRFIGKRWFSLWWERLPSLINPSFRTEKPAIAADAKELNQQWLRFGYVLIALLLLSRLIYLASGKIELSEDEAYQWTWSKHLALSYYSKPLLIAVVQFLGTHLWGDNAFGVRFFSPIIAAILSVLVLRFVTREIGGKVGVVTILVLVATPLLAVGSTLMTIDPLSVLFWTAAMITGWRAIQDSGKTADWLWTGLWMGLGFLSKYTNLFQFLCWFFVFVLLPHTRKHLRTRGPYLAILTVALCTIPVVVWNVQHHWITIEHVSNDGEIGRGWHPKHVIDFVVQELFLLNPFFFLSTIAASVIFWFVREKNRFWYFAFCMGAPLFIFYFVFSFHSRVLPNWIAPSVVPLFCLMIVFLTNVISKRHCKSWLRKLIVVVLSCGVVIGVFFGVLMHDTNLTSKLFKRTLPAKADPLRRVKAWSETGNVVNNEFHKLQQSSGVQFIICEHYGTTGELSFYMPEARRSTGSDQPLVYFVAKEHPENQYFFWPNYLSRKGENALFVQQLDEPKLVKGWVWKWLLGDQDLIPNPKALTKPPPDELRKQFDRIRDLGVVEVKYRGQVYRHLQLFECDGLK